MYLSLIFLSITYQNLLKCSVVIVSGFFKVRELRYIFHFYVQR